MSRAATTGAVLMGAMLWGRAVLAGLVDLVLPPSCLLCRGLPGPAGGDGVCPRCLEGVPFLVLHPCPGCGGTVTGGPLEFCPPCRQRFVRDGLSALTAYEGAARDLVHAFKYRADLGAGRFLGRCLGRAVAESLGGACEVVIPVPLHRRRLRARGFNQAALLGSAVARATGWSHLPTALGRVAPTRPLAGLRRKERVSVVRGSVFVRSPGQVAGRRVLLVDDVVASGATVEVCAGALKEAGAAAVVVAAAARSLPGKVRFH